MTTIFAAERTRVSGIVAVCQAIWCTHLVHHIIVVVWNKTNLTL